MMEFPPEQKTTGRIVCSECGEIIPYDDYYYVFNGKVYCPICVESHRHVAPREWEKEDDRF